MAEKPLTTKQKLFVEAYLANPNATEAARKAGYKGNDNTLATVGKENLRKHQITKHFEQRITNSVMSANEALERLSALAANKPDTHLLVSDGRGGTEVVEVKHADQLKALDMVFKYHGMYQENRINVQNDHVKTILAMVAEWSERTGKTAEDTLKDVLADYGNTIPPEIRQKLTSEMVM